MLKHFGAALILTGFATAATPADLFQDLSDTDREALHAEIRSYLLQNPGILEEMVALLQSEREAAEADRDRELLLSNLDQLRDDGVSAVLGNPEGDVTIVEFLDYQCSYCKRAHPEIAELLSTDGDIRLIRKEFPILGPASLEASKAAMAVLLNDGTDVYASFSDALMSFDGQLNAAAIEGIARKSGVDVATMKITAESPQVMESIEANRLLGQTLQITGTPPSLWASNSSAVMSPLRT